MGIPYNFFAKKEASPTGNSPFGDAFFVSLAV
jgi:hypothetical protein